MTEKNLSQTDVFRQQYENMLADTIQWKNTWKELARFIAPTRGFLIPIKQMMAGELIIVR